MLLSLFLYRCESNTSEDYIVPGLKLPAAFSGKRRTDTFTVPVTTKLPMTCF